jgi:GT2 family glycosyltransferase
VLVDNGCRDFSAEEVERLAPGGCYLASEANLGFAGGANLGMRAALARGAAWVWFLNNDALPEAGALAALLATATAAPAAAIVGAKILQRQAPDRLDSVASSPSPPTRSWSTPRTSAPSSACGPCISCSPGSSASCASCSSACQWYWFSSAQKC